MRLWEFRLGKSCALDIRALKLVLRSSCVLSLEFQVLSKQSPRLGEGGDVCAEGADGGGSFKQKIAKRTELKAGFAEISKVASPL